MKKTLFVLVFSLLVSPFASVSAQSLNESINLAISPAGKVVRGSMMTISWQLVQNPDFECGNVCEIHWADIYLVTPKENKNQKSYPIALAFYGATNDYTAYNWSIGDLVGGQADNGDYRIKVCKTGTSICDVSDKITIKKK